MLFQGKTHTFSANKKRLKEYPQFKLNLLLEILPGSGSKTGMWTTRELLHKHYSMGRSKNWRITDFIDASVQFANFNVNYVAAPLVTGAINNDAAFSATLIAAPKGFVARDS